MGREQASEPPEDRTGAWALALGVSAFVSAFLPAIGELVAGPTALAAIALGLVGLRRYETYRAHRAAPAVTGVVLGAGAGLVMAFVLVATHP